MRHVLTARMIRDILALNGPLSFNELACHVHNQVALYELLGRLIANDEVVYNPARDKWEATLTLE